jgi:hypothetical protein
MKRRAKSWALDISDLDSTLGHGHHLHHRLETIRRTASASANRRQISEPPQRLARGEYLVHITACMECHAPHQWTAHDAPIPPNMVAAGQDMTMLKCLGSA